MCLLTSVGHTFKYVVRQFMLLLLLVLVLFVFSELSGS